MKRIIEGESHVKLCKGCGIKLLFVRRKGDYKLFFEFKKKKFCNRSCHNRNGKPHLGYKHSIETKEQCRISALKQIHSKDAHKKIGLAHKGEKSHFWKGGISTYERKLYLNARRRATKLNAKGWFTEDQWITLKKEYKYTCPACFQEEPNIKLTIDHIIPLSIGGSNTISNIQPLCQSCNSRKHIKIIKYPNHVYNL